MRTPFTLLAVVLLAAGAAAQGIYWESTTTIPMAGDKMIASQTYAMPKMLKHVSNEGETMIMRLDRKVMYALQPEEKTYWQMSFADMESMMKKAGAKMDAAMKEMESAMKTMSPEERKMMESMLGDKMKGMTDSGPVEVRATGETKPIAGLTAEKYVATRDGEEVMTVWTTEEITEFAAMRKDWEEFNRQLLSMDVRMGKGMLEAFQKIKGFPMETDMAGAHTVVTKVERRSTPASAFEIPPDYARVDAPSIE